MAKQGQGAAGGLDAFMNAAREGGKKGLPPVHLWNPPFCGDLDMRIAADGTWFYMGTPIGRPALVRLFSTVLKREDDDYFLVTPVEKCRIRVDDAPFNAVEMQIEAAGDDQRIAFRTNVDDRVICGPGHAMRFAIGAADGVMPYVHVRSGLWARVTRALYYDLVALGIEREIDGQTMFGIMSSGEFYAMCPAEDISRAMSADEQARRA